MQKNDKIRKNEDENDPKKWKWLAYVKIGVNVK